MRSTTTPRFRKLLADLPPHVQRQARKQYGLWKQDFKHPSLHFKQVKPDVWSVRINEDFRALAVHYRDEIAWFWIGPHREYDRILR